MSLPAGKQPSRPRGSFYETGRWQVPLEHLLCASTRKHGGGALPGGLPFLVESQHCPAADQVSDLPITQEAGGPADLTGLCMNSNAHRSPGAE